MEKLVTNNFVVNYEPELEKFIKQTIDHAEVKRKMFYKIFDCDEKDIGALKASFFVKHDKFIDYIKSISGGRRPPDWATGCTYNNEIQVLVDLKNPENKMTTLAHETLHLFFNKCIYEKYNINRVNWLDEAFAVYLDGQIENLTTDKFLEMVNNISKLSKGFDMAILSDYNKVKTEQYNGYHMFIIIGKYIFENHLENEFLRLIKTNRNKVVEIGKTILETSISHFKQEAVILSSEDTKTS